MPYDDQPEMESPVSGLGEEMLPDRGLPFDDIEEEESEVTAEEAAGSETPANLSFEELTNLEGLVDDLPEEPIEVLKPPVMDKAQPDGGMGAAYPILKDEELEEAVGLAVEDIQVPTMESAGELPVYGREAQLDPGTTSGMHIDPAVHLHQMQSMNSTANVFVSKEQHMAMMDRLEQNQQMVRHHIPSLKLAQELTGQIDQARKTFLGNPQNVEQVEGLLNEVEIRIASIERAKEDNLIAIGLFVYQLVWAILFFIGFLRLGTWVRDFTLVSMGPDALDVLPTIASDMIFLTNTAIAGGFGAIMAALRAIWRHASQKLDFSRQYTYWYIASPLIGLLLGAVVFVVIRVLIFSLFIGAGSQEITSAWLLYFLAGAAGLFQDSLLETVRQIGKISSSADK